MKQFNRYAHCEVATLTLVYNNWDIDEVDHFIQRAKQAGAQVITYEINGRALNGKSSELVAWKPETEDERTLKLIAKKEQEIEELRAKLPEEPTEGKRGL